MMSEIEKKEERNRRIGWITAVAVQLVMLIFFYFLIAWKAPNPPIPEYGIELGFATSAGASSSTPPPEEVEELEEQEVQENEQQPVEELESNIDEQPEVEAEVDPELLEEAVVEEIESPVEVKETESKPVSEKTIKEIEKKNIEQKPVNKPVEKEQEKEVVEKPTEKPIEEPNTGDGQGEEEAPIIDQRGVYGSQGSSEGNNEGSSLSLAGWFWDNEPKPDDKSDQTGRIVYKIIVDSDGYLVKIEVVTSTVSPAVERKYRQAVEKLTFSKTVENTAAALSTGTITFIITSK